MSIQVNEQQKSNVVIICKTLQDFKCLNQNDLQSNIHYSHFSSLKKSKKAFIESKIDGCIIYKCDLTETILHDFIGFLKKNNHFPIPIIIAEHDSFNNQQFGQSVIILPVDTETNYIMGALFGLVHEHVVAVKSLKSANKILSASKNLQYGEFVVQTIDEAKSLSIFLSKHFSNANMAAIGIFELILNAIEHGNLQIGYELKCKLVSENKWLGEIEKRLNKMQSHKVVKIKFKQNDELACLLISDCGAGFDWKKFYYLDPAYSTKPVGRGILLAKNLCFDVLKYNETGNEVSAYSKKQSNFNWLT